VLRLELEHAPLTKPPRREMATTKRGAASESTVRCVHGMVSDVKPIQRQHCAQACPELSLGRRLVGTASRSRQSHVGVLTGETNAPSAAMSC
jgi:hypothetical protein